MEDRFPKKRALPRLAHKKSKMGCTRCKARKVKCDEVHPTCGGCERHGVTCEWTYTPSESGLSPAQDVTSSSSGAGTPPYAGVESDVLIESAERRLLEVRLMHHYVSSACSTFPAVDDPAVMESWVVYAPKMAFEHHFLLKSIFAVSALHLARTQPEPAATKYAHAHRVYLNAAVQGHRKAVADIGQHNADAISLTAAMISWQAFALYIQAEDQAQYTPPLQWLHMSAAIASIVGETRPWITESTRTHTLIFAKPHLYDLATLFDVKNSENFNSLLTWRPPSQETNGTTIPHETSSEDALTYQQLASYIGTIWSALGEKESNTMISRRFMALGSIMPTRFRDLLSQLDPRALVILAYFFAMTRKVESLWWFKDVAEREVNGIHSILPQAWHPLMAWPLAIINQNENRITD